MKKYRLSRYNYFIVKEQYAIGVNLYNQVLFSIDSEKYETLILYKDRLEKMEAEHPILFSTMLKLGIIEVSDFDLPSILIMENRSQVFDISSFHLFINPTLNCNFSCWYCYESRNKATMSKDIIHSVLLLIENLIQTYKLTTFHLDWFGGEPLLCFESVIKPISVEVKKIFSKYNVKYFQTITTNGSLLKANMIPFFEEHNFTNFQITLDGDIENHNKVRFIGSNKKKGSFYTIVNNINSLVKSPKLFVSLRINYIKNSLFTIDQIITFFPISNRGKIKIHLAQVFQDAKLSSEKEKKELIKEEHKMLAIFRDAGFHILKSWVRPDCYYTCYADLKNEALINYDGRVFNCTNVDFENEKESGILTEKGEIIWNENINAKRLSRATFDNEECLNCYYLPICTAGCHKNVNKEIFTNKTCLYIPMHEQALNDIFDFYQKQDCKIAHIGQIESMLSYYNE